MLYFKSFFILILLTFNTLEANNIFAVIVSSKSNITSISKKQISNIFLSKTKKLPNGEKAFPIELNNNLYIKEFYKRVSKKNPKKLKKYWATVIFTGKGQPPKKMNNIKSILNRVKNNMNAISYIPISTHIPNGIKVILELR